MSNDCRKTGEVLAQSSQGSDGVTIARGVQETWRSVTEGCSLLGMVGVG